MPQKEPNKPIELASPHMYTLHTSSEIVLYYKVQLESNVRVGEDSQSKSSNAWSLLIKNCRGRNIFNAKPIYPPLISYQPTVIFHTGFMGLNKE